MDIEITNDGKKKKKKIKALVLILPVLMILSFSVKVIFSSDGILSERKDLTVFQKVMLSVIYFSLKLLL